MARIDQRDQRLRRNMRIDLCRRDIGVAEQGLHGAQIRAAFQQMGGKGVAQHMRADPIRRDAGSHGQALDQLVQPQPGEMRIAP